MSVTAQQAPGAGRGGEDDGGGVGGRGRWELVAEGVVETARVGVMIIIMFVCLMSN